MIYLTPQGNLRHKQLRDGGERLWGQLITASHWHQGLNLDHGLPWAMDNEAFSGNWQPEPFFQQLDRLQPWKDTCLFVVAPDKVADAAETLYLFRQWSGAIKAAGYPVAFVAQDGQENLPLPQEFDVLFVGGSTDWKLSPQVDKLIRHVRKMQKWVHVGRVNSRRRIWHFRLLDVNSVDGTCIRYSPDVNYRRLHTALQQLPLLILED